MRVTWLFVLFLVMTLAAQGTSSPPSVGAQKHEKHIILVSWDGARKHWIDLLTENATLRALNYLKTRGTEVALRIVSHVTVTDPGLANIETGYGADVTGIDMNYFASAKKRLIPRGLTNFERLKAIPEPKWKTALIMPWPQGPLDTPIVSSNQDTIFVNAKPAIDYWFSSENVSWRSPNQQVQFIYGSALLKADFLAVKAADFIRANSNNNFYIRMHMVEPDTVGHAFSESLDGKITNAYREALLRVDSALGLIIRAVQETGIESDTAIMVTTDHGFIGVGHSGPPYPDGDPEVTTTWLITNSAQLNNELGWGLMDDIAPTVLALAGIDPTSIRPAYAETSKALPLWQANRGNREVTPPQIISVQASERVRSGELFNVTVVARDESGIRSVKLWFAFGVVDFRFKLLSRVPPDTYQGSVGPFSAGTELRWFIQVIDNSISFNSAYFPSEGSFRSLTIEKGEETQPPTGVGLGQSTLPVTAAIVVVIILILFQLVRRRMTSERKSPASSAK